MNANLDSGWVTAPAKLNLRLEVLGKRDDGFHELRTWMAAVDLCDRVRLRGTDEPGLQLELSGPAASSDIPRDGRNLVWRTLEAGMAEYGRRLPGSLPAGLLVELHKEIPSQAGLGGASSDAAAALRALDLLVGDGEEASSGRSALRAELLAELGSDCVFFEEGRSSGLALCRGRGELVQPLPPLPAEWRFVVLTPPMTCSTPEVFAAWAGRVASPARPGPRAASTPAPVGGALETWSDEQLVRWLANDLHGPAMVAAPELAGWLEGLPPACAGRTPFVLTGSGSSVFCLARSEELARTTLRDVQESGADLRGAWTVGPLRDQG